MREIEKDHCMLIDSKKQSANEVNQPFMGCQTYKFSGSTSIDVTNLKKAFS